MGLVNSYFQLILITRSVIINSSDNRGDVAQDILKEEAHTLLKDGAPRLKGQMPNGFFKMKYHGLIMALIEISDPPNTKDHIRFVGDKIKLAKNLKHLLKKVREKLKRKGDHELYQCIKVYIRHQVYSKNGM